MGERTGRNAEGEAQVVDEHFRAFAKHVGDAPFVVMRAANGGDVAALVSDHVPASGLAKSAESGEPESLSKLQQSEASTVSQNGSVGA